MTTTKTPFRWSNGHVSVRLHRVLPAGFRVETTNTTGFVIVAWTKSYADRDEAVNAYDHTCAVFAEYGSPQAVETLDRETRGILAEQERRTARRMHNPQVMAEATRILDSIADLNELALIVSLRAQFAA